MRGRATNDSVAYVCENLMVHVFHILARRWVVLSLVIVLSFFHFSPILLCHNRCKNGEKAERERREERGSGNSDRNHFSKLRECYVKRPNCCARKINKTTHIHTYISPNPLTKHDEKQLHKPQWEVINRNGGRKIETYVTRNVQPVCQSTRARACF